MLACCGGGGSTVGITGGIDTFTPAPLVLAYIRADTYTRLELEVDAVPGFGPRAGTASSVAQRLDALLDKPDGVVVTNDGTIASRGPDHGWTLAELDALADQTFDLAVPSNTVKMHVLCVDGHYDTGPGGGTVLGIAWGQQNIAIFTQTIEELCGASALPPLLQDQLCADAELAIWMHEVGHVIGLVDNGLPMQVNHEDPDHPGHDVDPDCVMYWAYEGDGLIARITDDLLSTGNSALDFDTECLADIAAVRDAP